MHCPTCGQNYPEGSQRFCDIDGTRLISLSDDEYRRGKQRVFSTILSEPKSESKGPEPTDPRFVFTEKDQKDIDSQMESLFFDRNQDEFSTVAGGEFEVVDEPAPPRTFGRKVDPYNIPAGHVEVGDRDHPSINNLEFNIETPEAFIGKLVKGRYEVIEFIGAEDTGYAYLAEDHIVPDKRVVVRLLTGEDLDDITKSIFAEERVSLGHFAHPNIVRLIDSGQFGDGTTFLISEYVDALTIADILQINGPLTSARTARVIRQASYALGDVHHEGVLHRDLRPDFLLVSQAENGSEQVKIANFGVSDGEPNPENLAYKAPEILDGRIPTIASDIYSLAVIAFQTLTGVTPFKSDTAKNLLRRQRAGLKVHPAELRRDVIPAVDYVFDKALAADPLRRFSTAREFGDALYNALTAVAEPPGGETPVDIIGGPLHESQMPDSGSWDSSDDVGQAIASATANPPVATDELAWTKRSPEPPVEGSKNWVAIAVVAFTILLLAAIGIWYYLLGPVAERDAANARLASANANSTNLDSKAIGDVPPAGRIVVQPDNTKKFQNTLADLKGDLYKNFLGFSLYYPSDWKVIGPQESVAAKSRGKFLDISRNTPAGNRIEQMLVSYYPSTGTFNEDAPKFPEMVRETNETLAKLLPNYQMLSEGETTLNGEWRGYEVRFQASGPDDKGGRMNLWGRRIFVPVARPGNRAGFEITLLATSNSSEIHSVDDVGTKGELKSILETFEPSDN